LKDQTSDNRRIKTQFLVLTSRDVEGITARVQGGQNSLGTLKKQATNRRDLLVGMEFDAVLDTLRQVGLRQKRRNMSGNLCNFCPVRRMTYVRDKEAPICDDDVAALVGNLLSSFSIETASSDEWTVSPNVESKVDVLARTSGELLVALDARLDDVDVYKFGEAVADLFDQVAERGDRVRHPHAYTHIR
jgi:hypothetical protein